MASADTKKFQFHYVRNSVGTIDGQSVLTQTEDAINEVGEYTKNCQSGAHHRRLSAVCGHRGSQYSQFSSESGDLFDHRSEFVE